MANLKQIIPGGVFTSTVTATLHSNLVVGTCLEDEKGIKYVLVQVELQSISTQMGCTVASGSTTGYTVTVSALSGCSPLAGIPVTTIPTGQFGFLQTSGQKRVKAASLIVSANNPCLLSSAGIFSQQSFATGFSTAACGATAINVCGLILSTTTAAAGNMDIFFKSGIFPG